MDVEIENLTRLTSVKLSFGLCITSDILLHSCIDFVVLSFLTDKPSNHFISAIADYKYVTVTDP